MKNMKSLIEIMDGDFERVITMLDQKNVKYKSRVQLDHEDNSDFDYIPSIRLWVAKETTLHGEDWFGSHKGLQEQGLRMLTLPEFREYLKYLVSSDNPEHLKIYRDIIEIKDPYRGERVDALFSNDGHHLETNHILDSDGKLTPQYSKSVCSWCTSDHLRKEISLQDYLFRASTDQGLPSRFAYHGEDMEYSPPGDCGHEKESVCFESSRNKFVFNGHLDLLYKGAGLGVRAAKDPFSSLF
ncbi:MAG: hypothetical protein V3V78_02145 [Candidatus Woesearchaeota archaeon]